MPGHLFSETRDNEPQQRPAAYKGFVAGAFSGVAKLSGKITVLENIHNLENFMLILDLQLGTRKRLSKNSTFALLTTANSFDTIKVRLQTSPASHFRGPVDCLLQTLRHEGVTGVYKGATPPLIGWVFMDSVFVICCTNT